MSTRAPEVPGYVDLEEIGVGGFSVVYGATQLGLQRPVALKVINAFGSQAARFEREAAAIGALSDVPGIAGALHVTFATDGRPVIVMPRFERSLADVVADRGAVPMPTVLRWAGQLAVALDGAHALGIIHRDIKPANVLISRRGDANLADFGIAVMDSLRAATVTTASFTPRHAPPERFNGRETADNSKAGDIYSFASTIYTALVGAPPFGKDVDGGSAGLMDRVINEPLPMAPQLSSATFAALSRAMAKDPADRPVSARAFVEELTDAARRPDPVRPAAVVSIDSAADSSEPSIADFMARRVTIDDTVVGGISIPVPPSVATDVHPSQWAAVRERLRRDPQRRRLVLVVAAGVVALAVGIVAGKVMNGLDDTDGSRSDTASGADATLLGAGGSSTSSPESTSSIVPADVTVVVGNGSGVSGRAKFTADFLVANGFVDIKYVDGIASPTTAVFFADDHRADGVAVGRMLGLDVAAVLPLPSIDVIKTPEPTAEVVVLLGADSTTLVDRLRSATPTTNAAPPTTAPPPTTSDGDGSGGKS